jgi:small subunit ribosomal protein S4
MSSPSVSLRAGDIIAVADNAREMETIKKSIAGKGRVFPWIEWNPDQMKGTFLAYPEREAIPETIKEQLIVELYSK